MKSEPDVFSIFDLVKRPGQTEMWDGVRNYQARNFMRDEMKMGDLVLFYHSNASPPGIAGTACVVGECQPDATALDKKSKYFDPKSTAVNNRWCCVTLGKPTVFKQYINLEMLRQDTILADMKVLQKGQRLSITPVTLEEFNHILMLGMRK